MAQINNPSICKGNLQDGKSVIVRVISTVPKQMGDPPSHRQRDNNQTQRHSPIAQHNHHRPLNMAQPQQRNHRQEHCLHRDMDQEQCPFRLPIIFLDACMQRSRDSTSIDRSNVSCKPVQDWGDKCHPGEFVDIPLENQTCSTGDHHSCKDWTPSFLGYFADVLVLANVDHPYGDQGQQHDQHED